MFRSYGVYWLSEVDLIDGELVVWSVREISIGLCGGHATGGGHRLFGLLYPPHGLGGKGGSNLDTNETL